MLTQESSTNGESQRESLLDPSDPRLLEKALSLLTQKPATMEQMLSHAQEMTKLPSQEAKKTTQTGSSTK